MPAIRAHRRSCPRGKILNVEKARVDKMLKNAKIQALILAIGAGVADDFDLDKIRYHKVISRRRGRRRIAHTHVAVTFFMRQMKALIEAGHVTSPSRPCTRPSSATPRST